MSLEVMTFWQLGVVSQGVRSKRIIQAIQQNKEMRYTKRQYPVYFNLPQETILK